MGGGEGVGYGWVLENLPQFMSNMSPMLLRVPPEIVLIRQFPVPRVSGFPKKLASKDGQGKNFGERIGFRFVGCPCTVFRPTNRLKSGLRVVFLRLAFYEPS